MQRAITATVSGRVHGVGFRYSTSAQAQRLGLDGWVRNLRDGTVAVLAQGDQEDVTRLIEFLHRGPPAARVHSVDIIDTALDPAVDGFRILA